MRLHVYERRPDGTEICLVPPRTVRVVYRPLEYNPLKYPPCACPQHRAARPEEKTE